MWAPQGAVAALLSCMLLGTRGSVGLDELCALGACHHVGVGIASLWHLRSKGALELVVLASCFGVLLLGFVPFTPRERRIWVFCVSRLITGASARSASEIVPVLVEQCRNVRFLQDYDASTQSFAVRGAPLAGSALGFALAFCSSLPLVARASLSKGGQSFLPKKLGKILAWYARLRRSTQRVPSNSHPPTCHQRAMAARDAWRWIHGMLGLSTVVSWVALRSTWTGGSAASRQHRQRRFEHSMFRMSALCVESALCLAHFLGAVTLQAGLRLAPPDALLAVIVGYGCLLPIGGVIGAVCLRLSQPRRRSRTKRKRREWTTSPLVRPRSTSLEASSEPAKRPRILPRSASLPPPERDDTSTRTPPATALFQQPARARPSRDAPRRRSAAAVAIFFLTAAAASACVTANLWRAEGTDVGVHVGLASIGAAAATVPSFAVLLDTELLGSPEAAIARALPLFVAGLAARRRSHAKEKSEDVPLVDDDKACREYIAPRKFRTDVRETASYGWLCLMLLALLFAAATCARATRPRFAYTTYAAAPDAQPLLRLAEQPLSPAKRGRSNTPRRLFSPRRRASTGSIETFRTSLNKPSTPASRLLTRGPATFRSPPHYESFPPPLGHARRQL